MVDFSERELDAMIQQRLIEKGESDTFEGVEKLNEELGRDLIQILEHTYADEPDRVVRIASERLLTNLYLQDKIVRDFQLEGGSRERPLAALAINTGPGVGEMDVTELEEAIESDDVETLRRLLDRPPQEWIG